MDRTTLILAAAVFGGVFLTALWLVPGDAKQAAKPVPVLTPQEQKEMEELKHDPYDPNLTSQQKFRLLARRDLIADYPLSVIDAAENDGPDGKDSYRIAVVTPPPGFDTLDAFQDTQIACVAWRNINGTVHETYNFKPGYISHSGIVPDIAWVRSGCAEAATAHGEVVSQRRVLQDLLDRIPTDNDHAEGRASVRDRLNDRRPPLEGQRGVQYFE